MNEDLRFINDDGHLVDSDGRLVNEEGKYIAYRTEEGKKNKDENEVYFVNSEGEEVISKINDDGEEEWVKKSIAERKPFLDEEGQPIITQTKEECKSEEESPEKTKESTTKNEDKPKTTKRKPRATKTDSKTV